MRKSSLNAVEVDAQSSDTRISCVWLRSSSLWLMVVYKGDAVFQYWLSGPAPSIRYRVARGTALQYCQKELEAHGGMETERP